MISIKIFVSIELEFTKKVIKKAKKTIKKAIKFSTIFLILINSNFSENQLQDIKKESLQYEFCLATETYCMIQNETASIY